MINDVERCHSGDCHQGNTDDPSCELHHFLTQPTRSDPFSSRSANWEDNMGDDSDANWQFRSEGTVVHQNEKTYWFKNDSIAGEEVPPLHAVSLVEAIVGRKLSDFEFKLLIARPINGSINITIVSMLVSDTSAQNGRPFWKSLRRVVMGYAVRLRENGARYNYGDVIGSDAFYDTDGNIVGEVKVTRKQEPPLESPLLDPIDFVGGALADIVRNGAKALLRGAMAGVEERLLARGATGEAANVIRTLTATELKVIRGGAASVKPPLLSAAELNKAVPQIKAGMGAKLMLGREERSGVMQILNVLERFRLNPKDESIWKDIGNRVIKKMEFGNYAKEGWIEIYVLEGNTGWNNRIRVIFRPVPGDIEAKLLQVH